MLKEIADRMICAECTDDAYLKMIMVEDGVSNQCDYCGGTAPALPIPSLSDYVYETFQRILIRARANMESFIRTDGAKGLPEFECDGVPNVQAILAAAKIPTQAAADVHDILKSKHVPRPIG